MSTIDHAGPVLTDEAEVDSSVTAGCSPAEPVAAKRTPTSLADLATTALGAAGFSTHDCYIALNLHASGGTAVGIQRMSEPFTRVEADRVAETLGVARAEACEWQGELLPGDHEPTRWLYLALPGGTAVSIFYTADAVAA